MHISELDIHNYRNLDGISIKFNDELTYIVGENNVGKSNVLDFLDTLFNRTTFNENDFTQQGTPITASVKLSLSEEEIGFFGILGDPVDPNSIKINMSSDAPDDDIVFTFDTNGDGISLRDIRRANYFHISSVDFDNRTLAFDSMRGVGRVLSRSVELYREQSGKEIIDLFDQTEVKALLAHLNGKIANLPLLSAYRLQAAIDTANGDAMASVVSLADQNNIGIKSTGNGVQYVTLMILSILQCLMSLSKARRENSTVTLKKERDKNKEPRSAIRAIISIDEPEIHLHPYMQRRLIKALSVIAAGEDEGFNAIVKDLLDIDVFQAQLIVVTHSPEILEKGSYKNIVRLGITQGKLAAVSGKDLTLEDKVLKQLQSQFSVVREAFFARAVIVVEGQTDEVALPIFANAMNKDLDGYGVLIIRAEGKGSVPGIQELLASFCIPNISIRDRDKTNNTSTGTSFYTVKHDFEEEWIESIFHAGDQHLFVKLIETVDPNGRGAEITSKQIEKAAGKLEVSIGSFPQNGRHDFKDTEFDGSFSRTMKTLIMMYAWLQSRKGALMPQTLAHLTPESEIPQVYRDAIIEAVRLAQ
ncbi:AAA family ATPase [Atopobium sp. oral taxon 810]|uniref:ATP-dependent nuclease n=1 Tax=Atopobium sp. oral taxon 810 TaxID=712158 RepID=UPI0018DBBD08|nr:AAA family ATPase [Atopobium sp. oral taxon 810]